MGNKGYRQLIWEAYKAGVLCAADATYNLVAGPEPMTVHSALLLLSNPAPLFLEG